MGNSPSRKSRKNKDDVASRAQKVAADFQAGIQNGIKKLEENDHPAAQLIDSVCGPYLDPDMHRQHRNRSYDESSSDEESDLSEDETTATDYDKRRRQRRKQKQQQQQQDEETLESASYLSQSDYESAAPSRQKSAATDESSQEPPTHAPAASSSKQQTPLASSFAKRCYFTKAGIGKTVQHYEGLTLTGNVVLMLANAMKLKGCPTICDEDLRRVEQTYPNQFSRLPDELLLSSGWRRISKYCHFSNKPIPDGVPFFHSKERLHPGGGYYFLLAAAVGMVRPCDVEPLNRDTLVLLETDFPSACDAAPPVLIQDPDQWTLVDRFCFFSGGPINTDEDVYYQADFDGNPIYMLAFLSPSLTPEELYKLPNGLETVAQVHEVESIYDLTERDFEDLKLYHLGPCRALPPYILQPQAWTKVLPPHFLQARETAMLQARDYEATMGQPPVPHMQQPPHVQDPHNNMMYGEHGPVVAEEPGYYNPSFLAQPQGMPAADHYRDYRQDHPHMQDHRHMPEHPHMQDQYRGPQYMEHPHMSTSPQYPPPHMGEQQHVYAEHPHHQHHMPSSNVYQQQQQQQHVQRQVEEEGTFADSPLPMDEAVAAYASRSSEKGMDPPEDEPPSLSIRESGDTEQHRDPSDEDEPYSPPSNPGEQYFEENTVEPCYTEESETVPSPDKTEESASDYFNEFQAETPTTGAKYFDESSGMGDSNYFVTPQTEQPLSPVSENDMLSPGPSTDNTNAVSPDEYSKGEIPPKSPNSDFSRSSAMKGAQELLRRNRQRRLDAARKRQEDGTEGEVLSPDSESGATWESGSEMTSVVSGSSVWTDNVSNPDRSSRRALILQMAKARMRNHKTPTTPTAEEEKKFQGEDIDLTEDLD